LDFVATVRGVERSIAAARRGTSVPDEFDIAPLGEISEQEWRQHWPAGDTDPEPAPAEQLTDDAGGDEN
jgi:XTP/dITP diphosphohydrolase